MRNSDSVEVRGAVDFQAAKILLLPSLNHMTFLSLQDRAIFPETSNPCYCSSLVSLA